MIKHRLSFLLVFGITCCGFNVSGEAKTPSSKPTTSIVTQNSTSQNSTVQAVDSIETVQLNYDVLMQAGYAADKKGDYVTALKYFRQALTLRPNDSWANKAIRNITASAFDRYMQAGYKADVNRDYQLALKHFQKALEIKPNSFHAQKAVANVSNYLAVNAQEPGNNKQGDRSSYLWMVFAIAGTAGISVILLFFLFKKTRNINLEPAIEEQPAANLFNLPNPAISGSVSENISEATEEETLVDPPPKKKSKVKKSKVKSEATENSPQETENNQSQEIVATNSNISKLDKLDIVLELIADLQKRDRSIRQKTIWELAQRGDSRAMQPLVELMIKVDSQERGLILEAMTQIASRTLKPMNKALIMSLEDDNPHVKQNAIRDLTRVYELMNQVTKRLSQVVEDSDEEVQKTAKWALKQLNQMPKVPLWQNPSLVENNQDISN